MAIENTTDAEAAEDGHDDSAHRAEFWMLGFGAGLIVGTVAGIAVGEMILGIAFGFVLGAVLGTLIAVR
jgi:hypothetical protein